MENEPFASNVECCCITNLAGEILGTHGFADEDDSDERSQREDPIMIFTAAQTLPPICNASTGVVPGKAVDFGKDKVPSVLMYEMVPEVVDLTSELESESETENYWAVRLPAALDVPKRSELRCGSSKPSVVHGQDKVQNVQDNAIEDDQQPSKMAKSDCLIEVKEIAEHQNSAARGQDSKVQNVEDSAIGDDQQPSKMVKSDCLIEVKEIAEHQNSAARGQDSKVQNVEDSAIEDDQRPSKMAKSDCLVEVKEIAEHQNSAARGQDSKVQNVEDSAIGDDQRPSKMVKSDCLIELKEIAEHQSSSVRGQDKVQNVEDSAIGDDQRPLKLANFDCLAALKEIAEHHKSCSSIRGFTYPRPGWWPEHYEDVV